MKKRNLILAIMCVVLVLGLVGCGGHTNKKSEEVFATKVYALKNPYIENTEADHALVRALEVNNLGKYTMEVHAKEAPNSLDIRFMYLYDDVDAEQVPQRMLNTGIALMALIDECELVEWSYPTDEGLVEGAIGVTYANELMGTDIKEAGKDEASFTALCERLFPEKVAKAEE